MPPRRVAVVIPALDEESGIAAAVASAREHADLVVVSDGGSRDGTAAAAREAGATVVPGPAGRGAQLRTGADEALERGAGLLVFLHADTRLPERARALVEAAAKRGALGGGFRLRFDSERPVRRLGARLINWRTRLTGCPLGDQAQFATAEAYRRLGGFRPWPLLEDLDFIRRLKRLGPTETLAAAVTTSSRRFDRLGTGRTVALNWLIFALYFLGVSPERLAALYRRPLRRG